MPRILTLILLKSLTQNRNIPASMTISPRISLNILTTFSGLKHTLLDLPMEAWEIIGIDIDILMV